MSDDGTIPHKRLSDQFHQDKGSRHRIKSEIYERGFKHAFEILERWRNQMAKFPKTLFVKHEGSGDEAWLNPAESADHHAELGESIPVGIYQLVEVKEISTSVSLDAPKRTKRR